MKYLAIWGFFILLCANACNAFTPLIVTPPGMEKCFGIADAGQNDGPFMADYPEASEGPGQSRFPCERTAWRWVKEKTCTTIMIGFTENGTALTGTLEPRPEGVNPVKCLPYRGFGPQAEGPNASTEGGSQSAEPAPAA